MHMLFCFVVGKMNKDQAKVRRIHFMKQLAEDQVKPHLERRVNKPGLHRELQDTIRRILKIDQVLSTSPTNGIEKFEVRKTCSTCD